MYQKRVALFVLVSALNVHGKSRVQSPPHCTVVTKEDQNYAPRFRFDYPVAYIMVGQREVYQELYCLNPPSVSKGWTSVCDWAAPPQVQFTIGYDYVHVERHDPSGQFMGKAIISTHQLCSHNYTQMNNNENNAITVNQIEN